MKRLALFFLPTQALIGRSTALETQNRVYEAHRPISLSCPGDGGCRSVVKLVSQETFWKSNAAGASYWGSTD